MRLEIEEEALQKETDKASKRRLVELGKELVEVREEADVWRRRWEKEKESIGRVQRVREEVEQTKQAMLEAERAYDLNRMAELRHGRLPLLEVELRELEHRESGDRLLKE